MTTISVPLPQDQTEFIAQMIKSGDAETMAGVIRKALRRYEEEKIIENALLAEQEAREGRVFRGNLREIAKRFKEKK